MKYNPSIASSVRGLVSAGFFILTLSLAPSPARAADLVHRWGFDTLQDSVGGANVTLVGGALLSGGQLELPGGGALRDYAAVEIGSTIASLQSMTVESWFTLDSRTADTKVWFFTSPEFGYVGFTPWRGYPKIDFKAPHEGELNTTFPPNATGLEIGQAYYVATVYDATLDLMSFYVDGVLADSASLGGHAVADIGTTTENFFGTTNSFFNDADMDGRIDEMRIWDGVLTPDEIAQHALAGPELAPVPEPGTAGFGLCVLAAAAAYRRRWGSQRLAAQV
jgi:hypothetical protein